MYVDYTEIKQYMDDINNSDEPDNVKVAMVNRMVADDVAKKLKIISKNYATISHTSSLCVGQISDRRNRDAAYDIDYLLYKIRNMTKYVKTAERVAKEYAKNPNVNIDL